MWLKLRHIQTPLPEKKLAWVIVIYSVREISFPNVIKLVISLKIRPHFHVNLIRKAYIFCIHKFKKLRNPHQFTPKTLA